MDWIFNIEVSIFGYMVFLWIIGFTYSFGRLVYLVKKGTIKSGPAQGIMNIFFLLLAWPLFIGFTRDD